MTKSKRRTADGIPVRSAIRVNVYEVVSRAVEEGIAYGYRRAHKHEESPGEEHVKAEIEQAVMSALSDVLLFSESAE